MCHISNHCVSSANTTLAIPFQNYSKLAFSPAISQAEDFLLELRPPCLTRANVKAWFWTLPVFPVHSLIFTLFVSNKQQLLKMPNKGELPSTIPNTRPFEVSLQKCCFAALTNLKTGGQLALKYKCEALTLDFDGFASMEQCLVQFSKWRSPGVPGLQVLAHKPRGRRWQSETELRPHQRGSWHLMRTMPSSRRDRMCNQVWIFLNGNTLCNAQSLDLINWSMYDKSQMGD